MRDKLRNLFSGRQGMDELAKFQFWFGLAGFLIGCFLPGFLGRLFIWLGIFSLISAFVRAFSRQLDRREMENRAYLAYLDRWKNKYAAWKDASPSARATVSSNAPAAAHISASRRAKARYT